MKEGKKYIFFQSMCNNVGLLKYVIPSFGSIFSNVLQKIKLWRKPEVFDVGDGDCWVLHLVVDHRVHGHRHRVASEDLIVRREFDEIDSHKTANLIILGKVGYNRY